MAPTALPHHHHLTSTNPKEITTLTQIAHQGARDKTSLYRILHSDSDSDSDSSIQNLDVCSAPVSMAEVLSPLISPSLSGSFRVFTTSTSYLVPGATTTAAAIMTTSPLPLQFAYRFQQPQPQHHNIHEPPMQPIPIHSPPPQSQSQPRSPPPWLLFLIAIIFAISASWILLVFAIHVRGRTTGFKTQTQPQSQMRRGRGMAKEPGCEKKPRWTGLRSWRKLGGYYKLDKGEEEEEGAITTAHDISTLTIHERQAEGDTSPMNPYLISPSQTTECTREKVRSSREWAVEHRAFFQNELQVREREGYALDDAELEDVEEEVQEAQGRPLLGGYGELEGVRDEKGMSWVDLGLAMVDGTVDSFVAGIVRWVDDDGGDEALVLPLAKGKEE